MERELFDWCAWDEVGGSGYLEFHGCTLKVSLGGFKVGDLVPIILTDFERGLLQLLDKKRVILSEHKVRLALC